MARITVIGSMNVDHVANMERFPEAGESVIGTALNLYPGGKGANQCVAVARLGRALCKRDGCAHRAKGGSNTLSPHEERGRGFYKARELGYGEKDN